MYLFKKAFRPLRGFNRLKDDGFPVLADGKRVGRNGEFGRQFDGLLTVEAYYLGSFHS